MKKNLLPAIIGLALILNGHAHGAEPAHPLNGRVCLAKVPEQTPGERSLGNPTGMMQMGMPIGYPKAIYSVRIDNSEPIQLSTSSVHWVSELGFSKPHKVEINTAGKRPAKFQFRFNEYKFKHRDKPDLCLYLSSLYETWQLRKVEETGDWCSCWSNE